MGNQRVPFLYQGTDVDDESDGENSLVIPRPMALTLADRPVSLASASFRERLALASFSDEVASFRPRRDPELAITHVHDSFMFDIRDFPNLYAFRCSVDSSPQAGSEWLDLYHFARALPWRLITEGTDEFRDEIAYDRDMLQVDYFLARGGALLGSHHHEHGIDAQPLRIAARYSGSHPWQPPPAPWGARGADDSDDDSSSSSTGTHDSMPGLIGACRECGSRVRGLY